MSIVKRPHLFVFIPRRIQKTRKGLRLHIRFRNGTVHRRTIFSILQIHSRTITDIILCYKFIETIFIKIRDILEIAIIGEITNSPNIIATIMEIRDNFWFISQAITGKMAKEITSLTLTSALI